MLITLSILLANFNSFNISVREWPQITARERLPYWTRDFFSVYITLLTMLTFEGSSRAVTYKVTVNHAAGCGLLRLL